MKRPNSIADLKPAGYNPREISPDALKGLGKSLGKFGDISGIVWNARTGVLVAGHQRLKALMEVHDGKLVLKSGAIETPMGERFAVRVVDWDEVTEKAANVSANNRFIEGEFTEGLTDILAEIKANMADFEELCFPDVKIPDATAPQDFKEFDETIATDHECPKCGYRWSGKAKSGD